MDSREFVADFSPMVPFEHQHEIHQKTIAHIRSSSDPAYIYASVSAGKSLSMAMVAKHAQDRSEQFGTRPLKILCMARTGELVEQNAEEFWGIGAKNSIFSQSVGIKSTRYPCIVGSEGSLCRALDKQLKDIVFDVFLSDECHTGPYDDPDSQFMKIYTELKRRNPKLRLIGYTGSPWRGVEPIKGPFWKKELYRIDMWELVKKGRVEPVIFGFGHDDVQYNLADIEPSGKDGTEDFGKSELAEMQRRIMDSGTTTQKIMLEVMQVMETRNCALITCAGSKHIKECASVLPEGSYATITERTTYKERQEIKKRADSGQLKYILQIGCWTVGVNIPPIDTIVILRKIGSLTLLTQLIGRGIRKLKQYHKDLGMLKRDCLCLDYAGTMESLGHLFYDPMLESAEFERAKRKEELINCPRCNHPNSKFARRCIGPDTAEADGRCGFFWTSQRCEGKLEDGATCNTENDIVARECRACGHQLKDPNANLSGKHYTDADLKEVLSHSMTLTKNRQGLVVRYQLPGDEVATEVFYPQSQNAIARKLWHIDFVAKHLHKGWHNRVRGKTAVQILAMKAIFDWPTHVTHRYNPKGKSILHYKKFRSGRVEK